MIRKYRTKEETPVEETPVEEIPVSELIDNLVSSLVQPNKLTEIEQFIYNAGSDDVPTFGGQDIPGSIQCQQVPDELAPCILKIMESGTPVKSYLEIGSAAGGSAFLINHFLKPEKIILVDNNQHPKAHVRGYVLSNIKREEIIGNSHDFGTRIRVAQTGGNYDCLMVDGDHLYDGAKSDVEYYGAFVKQGGFLIFHDSQVGYPYGCAKVFEELKQDNRWNFIDEFVSKKYNKCGIGLFQKGTTKNVSYE